MASALATAASFTATRAITIVIASDHGLFRAGLRGLLQSETDFRVIGEAVNSIEAIDVVQALTPDVLLLDLSITRRTGLDVLRAFAKSQSEGQPRTIVLAVA